MPAFQLNTINDSLPAEDMAVESPITELHIQVFIIRLALFSVEIWSYSFSTTLSKCFSSCVAIPYLFTRLNQMPVFVPAAEQKTNVQLYRTLAINAEPARYFGNFSR
ncbi:hypothetical protein TNCV_4441941 [Trichonephila clavipes]|nr:hypothetical protein TNCV_4441941 [Trichonephila clavipes]